MIVDLKASLLGVEASSVYSLLPLYDVNTDTTSIVAASAIFNSGMVGMAFYPDSTQRNAYEIKRYVSSQNIIVAGNVKGIEDTNTTMQVCRRGIITEESGRVLLDVDAAFTSPMAGWRVELNLEKPAILNLGGYVSASKMQLQGDPLFLVDLRTERYHIAAPPGVCGPNTGTSYSATGATADPRDRNKANASNPGSRYLWAGYMYLTPIVGVWNGSSIQGSQSGINKLGHYHCWHRTYDVSTGRWTTPDINATPYSNLLDYTGQHPVQRGDPTGLESAGSLTSLGLFYMIGSCGGLALKIDMAFNHPVGCKAQQNSSSSERHVGLSVMSVFMPSGECCCQEWSLVQFERLRELRVVDSATGEVDWRAFPGSRQGGSSHHAGTDGSYVARRWFGAPQRYMVQTAKNAGPCQGSKDPISFCDLPGIWLSDLDTSKEPWWKRLGTIKYDITVCAICTKGSGFGGCLTYSFDAGAGGVTLHSVKAHDDAGYYNSHPARAAWNSNQPNSQLPDAK